METEPIRPERTRRLTYPGPLPAALLDKGFSEEEDPYARYPGPICSGCDVPVSCCLCPAVDDDDTTPYFLR